MADANITTQLAASAAKLTPPAVVTAYALVSKGLPFVISFLTLVYLAFQIAHLLWTWGVEMQRKRDVDRALRGRVSDYTEKAPK